ncbi:unnamed protein product [Ambrosiozyma monospora]|uniref:Unnamed protein product n=1 Tax=Ambrosiozyma monospora TaxID=43982 RepID=A0ACB5SVR3_AMBMO|nr:unnamed protein product [Ambrosiozyma monospora]
MLPFQDQNKKTKKRKNNNNNKNKSKKNNIPNAQKKAAREEARQEKLRLAQELAQLNSDNFIQIVSALPIELQDRIMIASADFAQLEDSYEMFADIIKKAPRKFSVDLMAIGTPFDCPAVLIMSQYIPVSIPVPPEEFNRLLPCIKTLGILELSESGIPRPETGVI